jgi:hypothetical protein
VYDRESTLNTWYKNCAWNPTATGTQNQSRIRIRFGTLKPKKSKNCIYPHLHYSRLYLILQTTCHSTHTHASSTSYLLGKCPCGQMSFWANVFLGRCLSWQMSFWANVFLGKCPSGQTSAWANVFWVNVFLGKCLSEQMSSGQTSYGQTSIWANIFLGKCLLGRCLLANVVLGKCLWANVSGQMSYGQMSGHRHACHARQFPNLLFFFGYHPAKHCVGRSSPSSSPKSRPSSQAATAAKSLWSGSRAF